MRKVETLVGLNGGDTTYYDLVRGVMIRSTKKDLEEAMSICCDLIQSDGYALLNDFYAALGVAGFEDGGKLCWAVPEIGFKPTVSGMMEMTWSYFQPKIIHESYHLENVYPSELVIDGKYDYDMTKYDALATIMEPRLFIEPKSGFVFQSSMARMMEAMEYVKMIFASDGFATMGDLIELGAMNEEEKDNAPEYLWSYGWERPVAYTYKGINCGIDILDLSSYGNLVPMVYGRNKRVREG